MVRPTSPAILPDHASLHLVRLEADEQFMLAVVATTSSEASCPLCQKKACVRQILTERLPEVVAPYARRTTRLGDLFTLIGFADGEGKQASAWLMEWG